MTVLDQIRKLDEQKAQLLDGAKKEALAKANDAIRDLAELGFNYRLVQGEGTPTVRTGTRRSGIRDDVLAAVKKAGTAGVTRAVLLKAMSAKGNKSAEQSISNALAALKKGGKITGEDGVYKVR